jgi:2-keto-4-pentenoate hydratase
LSETDPRVARGLESQLHVWRQELAQGERRVGWKIGLNVPAVQEQLGIRSPVIGFLTSATELEPGAPHSLEGGTAVGVEAEVAVHIGSDVAAGVSPIQARDAIAALGAAIELVDIDLPFEDVERILAANVFHRGFMLGPADRDRAGGELAGVLARIDRNGQEQASLDAAGTLGDLAQVVCLVASLLGEQGERLESGDVIISGSLNRILFVGAGDVVAVDFGPLGALEVSFTSG